MRRTVMVVVFFAIFWGAWNESSLKAQKSPFKVLKKLSEKADIDALFKAKPALTTSLADAATAVPFLDDFQPGGFEPLSLQPRGSGGTFLIKKGGLYVFEAESYCLKAGTRGPGHGEGYLQAPLKGPRAEIIRGILFHAADYPEVSQKDIQVLLWAILAHAKIDHKSGKLLKTAMVLLTPKEILETNGGALGILSDKGLEKVLDKVSPALRNVYKAEAELRNALSHAEASYEELERIAVLSGEAAAGDEGPEVPRGRWSYNPKGYFIRYFPEGYSRTVIEIYQPEVFTVERDPLGRVTTIAHPDGERVEIEYKARGEAPAVPGDTAMSACAVGAIRLAYVYPREIGRIVEAECPDPGWTLSGNSGGKGRPLPEYEGFPALANRYEASLKHKAEIKDLLDGLKKTGRKIHAGDIDEKQWERIMSLYHVVEVLKLAAAEEKLKHPDWMSDPVELAYRAWQAELVKALKVPPAGAQNEADAADPGRGPSLPVLFTCAGGEDDDGGFEPIDLSPDGAQPGNPGSQRGGNSNRGTKENEKCDGEYNGCKLVARQDCDFCFADCLMMEKVSASRLCIVDCQRKYRQDQKDCQTMVRNCKGL